MNGKREFHLVSQHSLIHKVLHVLTELAGSLAEKPLPNEKPLPPLPTQPDTKRPRKALVIRQDILPRLPSMVPRLRRHHRARVQRKPIPQTISIYFPSYRD